MSRLDRAADILTELVKLKSSVEDDIRPMARYVSAKLDGLGIEHRLHNGKGRPAIIAQFGSAGVLLSGHLDTVPHGTGWKHGECEVVKGLLYGRGTCDMKGGCAAMLVAAERLVANDVPFSLCFTTDEETGMKGAEAAAKDRAMKAAPAILVAEPTNFDIVVREKGLLQLMLRTSGVSAHASMPEHGENAITKMTGMLCKLDDLARVPHDTLANLTLCIDVIRGGTQINVIPSSCEAEIDTRYPASMSSDDVIGLIKKRIGRTGHELTILHQLDPVATDPNHRAVRTLKDILGSCARAITVPYATEMVMFRGNRRPMMVCGAGDPKVCHANDEHIPIEDIEKAAKIYAEYCTRMARGRS